MALFDFVLDIVVVGLLSGSLRMLRNAAQLQHFVTEKDRRIEILEADFRALLECSRTIGNRINRCDHAERVMQKQIDKLQVQDDSQVAIQHAMTLLRQGFELDEVTGICDLSHGEVEILAGLTQWKVESRK